MNFFIVKNRAIFIDTLFKASVRYYENDKGERFPYININTNDKDSYDVAEIKDIFKEEKICFLTDAGSQRCTLSLAIMPNLMVFIDFIMYEVRKNHNLLDVSKLE